MIQQSDERFVSGGRRYGRNTWLNERFIARASEAPIGYRLAYVHPQYRVVFTKISEDCFSVESWTRATSEALKTDK